MPKQPSNPQPDEGTSAGRGLAAAVAGLVTAGLTVLGALGVLRTIVVLQHTVATVLLVLASVQFVNSWLRKRLRHWKDVPRPLLWRELAFCGVVLLIDGFAGWVLGPSTLGLLVLMLPIAAVSALVDSLETSIADAVAEAGRRSVTEYIGSCEVYGKLSGSHKSLKESVADAQAGLFARIVYKLLQPLPSHSMSRTRVWITTLIFAMCIMFGGAALASLIVPDSPSRPKTQTHPQKGIGGKASGHHPTRGRGQRPATGKLTTTQLPPPSGAETRWDKTCASEPGKGAPTWAAGQLYALYLLPPDPPLPPGVTGPPGTVGGCTGSVTAPFSGIEFVYTIGTDPSTGAMASIAVDSLLRGSALFLAPAAQPVLDLIHAGQIVGGSHRIRAGNGDLYAVYVAGGTIMLIRPQYWKTSGKVRVAQAYTQLPPAVSDAWFDAMQQLGVWLWPIERIGPSGKATFRLVDSMITKRQIAEIDYDASNGFAHRRMGAASEDFGPRGIELSEAELLTWAARAR